MTPQEVDALVNRYLTLQLDTAEVALATPGQTMDDLEATEFKIHDQIEVAAQDLRFNRFATIRKDALALLGVTTVDEGTDAFQVLCRRLLEARLEALWAELHARQGKPLRHTKAPTQATVSSPSITPTATATVTSPLLSKAFDAFNKTEGERKRWRPQTRKDHELVQSILLQFIGDKPVAQVSKADLLQWFSQIRLIPVRTGTRFKGMNTRQIVEATRGQKIERISDKSINARYLSTVKAFFNYAVKVDWIAKSPAVALDPIKIAGNSGSGDKGFTPAELKTVFDSLPAAASKVSREGYYWLAVLALHSGARLDEVAGLRIEDVRQTEGHWCLHINEAGGRSLKNEYSARVVPTVVQV